MRLSLIGFGCLSFMLTAGASVQDVSRPAPSPPAEARHDCPMMQEVSSHMTSAMTAASSPTGQTNGMPKGMEHCSAMHNAAAPPRKSHPMHGPARHQEHKEGEEQ